MYQYDVEHLGGIFSLGSLSFTRIRFRASCDLKMRENNSRSSRALANAARRDATVVQEDHVLIWLTSCLLEISELPNT